MPGEAIWKAEAFRAIPTVGAVLAVARTRVCGPGMIADTKAPMTKTIATLGAASPSATSQLSSCLSAPRAGRFDLMDHEFKKLVQRSLRRLVHGLKA
jgi:hypothetical protein